MTSKQGNEGQKSRRKLYALVASLAVIVIVVAALLIPQAIVASQNSTPLILPVSTSLPLDSDSTMGLSLNYAVGDRMVYSTTTTTTAQQSDLVGLNGTPQTENSTASFDVLNFNGENYTVKEIITATIGGRTLTTPLNLDVGKTDYYKKLFTGADIFIDTSNPTVSAYLGESSAKIGEVWTIPVNTGNASFGTTGELTLTFQGIQDLTVPAGTYKCFRIDVSSNILTVHADSDYLNAIHIAPFDKSTLQMHGITYLEQGTDRLIKSDITQDGIVQHGESKITSTTSIEKVLVEYAKISMVPELPTLAILPLFTSILLFVLLKVFRKSKS